MPTDLETLINLGLDRVIGEDLEVVLPWLKRPVSGTYRNATPAAGGSILELRVDVDGRRPQDRLSGDLYTQFSFCGIPITFYNGSFVVDQVTEAGDSSAIELSGPVRHYANPTKTGDRIEVHIPRVNWFASPAAACVEWYTNGALVRSYLCPKISEYYRKATLEIDRFQGTTFPPTLDPDIDPSPSGLPASVSIREVFLRSGIDLTVTHDDTLNDPDSADPGSNWSEAELHDLMEDRFDSFSDRLQWNLYGVIVPRFGDPTYNSGYYGTMFDWGGWQAGDSFLRQGFAIADDATRGRTSGTLYNTADKENRLVLQTLIHEAGHAFNLPHTWQRTVDDDTGSESFMNYPWGYDGGETSFWSNFRWEFDDVELIWMRHADRNDVIFGGRDWIGDNLSVDLSPAFAGPQPADLDIISPDVFDIGVPVTLELRLENVSDRPLQVVDRLQPEDGLLKVVIERPNGEIVTFVPPVRRLLEPPDPLELAPGDAIHTAIGLSFGAKGHHFAEPGSYLIRIFWPCFPLGFVATAIRRIRIAHPLTRGSEELAHLLTSREAAQFLYYGGTRRHPEVKDQLMGATERYAETDPVGVRHIAAALAKDEARSYKHVDLKDGEPVVVASKPDIQQAAKMLAAAVSPLPDEYQERSAFRPSSESALVAGLAEDYVEMGRKKEATDTLDEAVDRLKERGEDYATEDLQRLAKNLKRRKT
ncbi:MAG: M66 family metalloprotease [Acidimicrobiia bacterium]